MRIALLFIILFMVQITPIEASEYRRAGDIKCAGTYKLQGDDLSKYNVNWNDYFESMTAKIKKKWHPPLRFDKLPYKTIVLMTIDKNGKLVDARLVSYCSCKEKEAKATLKAVKDAAPFEKLPQNFTKDTLIIEYEFKSTAKSGEKLRPKLVF